MWRKEQLLYTANIYYKEPNYVSSVKSIYYGSLLHHIFPSSVSLHSICFTGTLLEDLNIYAKHTQSISSIFISQLQAFSSLFKLPGIQREKTPTNVRLLMRVRLFLPKKVRHLCWIFSMNDSSFITFKQQSKILASSDDLNAINYLNTMAC